MSSNNVIQFPGSGKPDPKKETQVEKASSQLSFLQNKHLVGFFIITFSLFTFNYKFFSSSEGGSAERSSLGSGRVLASVDRTNRFDTKAQLDFARSLSSVDLQGSVRPEALGRAPSSDDRIRHGVLSSRGYIFKRSLEDGNLVSIELQSDEHNPAYLLDPQEFLREYGQWVNKDFSSIESIDQEDRIENDKRISSFILETKSGRRFKIIVERDLFQRLTMISQTEVDQNSFN